jgi:tryptophanyl-tRNA synthetase
VPEHAELAWVFNCVARMGWLNRMTQFKEQGRKGPRERVGGPLRLPDLMAADILAYRATHVPVGEDQKQHLELTRDIAQIQQRLAAWPSSRAASGDASSPLTEPLIRGPGHPRSCPCATARKDVRSRTRPTIRASTSPTTPTRIGRKNPQGEDGPERLPGRSRRGIAARPGPTTSVGIFAALADVPRRRAARLRGAQFSTFKGALVDLAVDKMGPIGAEMKRLTADPAHINAVLADGATRARALAARDRRRREGRFRVRAGAIASLAHGRACGQHGGAAETVPS